MGYRNTHGPNPTISFPTQIRYFVDPIQIIIQHIGYLINPKMSRLLSLSLSSVYKFIINKDLANAHDSIADAKAQTEVVLHSYFKSYRNKKCYIYTVSDIWE